MNVSELIESFRRDHPVYPRTRRGDACGYFQAKGLNIIASDGSEWPFGGVAWEHVSVSAPTRCPTWDEMCWVKRQFWTPEETVIQFHPAQSSYVNTHATCLHLWKPIGIELPLPPTATLAPAIGGAR